jgi:hypothetical protein
MSMSCAPEQEKHRRRELRPYVVATVVPADLEATPHISEAY